MKLDLQKTKNRLVVLGIPLILYIIVFILGMLNIIQHAFKAWLVIISSLLLIISYFTLMYNDFKYKK
jgi:hypothetical protein